ncbi:MAG: hypothetical protein PHH01_01530 [Patescibacteria group bacterium]|nr:hypothetical protein [Patescibacteria group bacterium]
MKIYFFASHTARESTRQNQNRMRKLLEQSGSVVISNLNPTGEIAESLMEKAEELGQSVLDQIDVLVIEGSGSDPEIGYLLAYAISAKKPTLYLMEKGSQANNPLVFLASKKIPSHVVVKIYSTPTLEPSLYEMLGQLEDSEFAGAPTIKFTLRITHQIEQYLHWKTHNTNLSKADYLRRLIEDLIKKDEEYRKYRKKRT